MVLAREVRAAALRACTLPAKANALFFAEVAHLRQCLDRWSHLKPCSGSAAFRRQPQNDVAVALAGTAQEAQPVDQARLEPDQALAIGVDLVLVAGRCRATSSGRSPRTRLERSRS